jgi:hypothetical protein
MVLRTVRREAGPQERWSKALKTKLEKKKGDEVAYDENDDNDSDTVY